MAEVQDQMHCEDAWRESLPNATDTVRIERKASNGMKWEYMVREFNVQDTDKIVLLEEFLNETGSAGWELVGVATTPTKNFTHLVYLKREAPSAADAVTPDFLDTRGRLGILEFPFDLFDVFDSQAGSVVSRVFDDAYEYVLVFLQVQRLQGPQHTILVHGVNLERHATIVQPKLKCPEFEL